MSLLKRYSGYMRKRGSWPKYSAENLIRPLGRLKEMNDEAEAQIKTLQQELFESGAMLFAAQKVASDEVQEQTKRAYGRLLDAHMLATGVLGAVLIRTNGKIVEQAPTGEERNALFASFVIGLNSCEKSIVQ